MSTLADSWVSSTQFQRLNDLRDIDLICDCVYDRAESFRKLGNQILSSLKDSAPSHFTSQLSQMKLYAADSTVLTFHSLLLSGLAFSPLSRVFVESFSELFSSFFEFQQLKNEIPSLRRLNRRISKHFDTYINIVENPSRSTIDFSEFDSLKNGLYANLASVCVQLARFSALSPSDNVNRTEVIETLQGAMQSLSESVSEVRSKSVGRASGEVGSLIAQLKESTSNLDGKFNLACFACFGIAKTTQILSDRIVIEPDPQSAVLIPSTFDLPSNVSKPASTNDAFDEMEVSRRHLETATKNFKTSIDLPLALSKELLQSLKEFISFCSIFAEKVISLSLTLKKSQAELQPQIHSFGNSVNAIQLAMKSRLLRSPRFAAEMDDAMKRFQLNLNHLIVIFREQIKAQNTETNDLDDVSRELLAASKAINEMSNKLSQFASQAEISTSEEADILAFNAEPGTFSAFLIQNSQPILKATQKILIRAREITAELIKQFGRIDNEAGIIRCAQDLSESAELLIICAEILLHENDPDWTFKVIAASKIIRGSVASLVAQVLVKGGDSQGIMNEHVKTLSKYTDLIISSVEKIVDEKFSQEESKKPAKKITNPMILKLNLQNDVNAARKQLQDDEKALYDFRRSRVAK